MVARSKQLLSGGGTGRKLCQQNIEPSRAGLHLAHSRTVQVAAMAHPIATVSNRSVS